MLSWPGVLSHIFPGVMIGGGPQAKPWKIMYRNVTCELYEMIFTFNFIPFQISTVFISDLVVQDAF